MVGRLAATCELRSVCGRTDSRQRAMRCQYTSALSCFASPRAAQAPRAHPSAARASLALTASALVHACGLCPHDIAPFLIRSVRKPRGVSGLVLSPRFSPYSRRLSSQARNGFDAFGAFCWLQISQHRSKSIAAVIWSKVKKVCLEL